MGDDTIVAFSITFLRSEEELPREEEALGIFLLAVAVVISRTKLALSVRIPVAALVGSLRRLAVARKRGMAEVEIILFTLMNWCFQSNRIIVMRER